MTNKKKTKDKSLRTYSMDLTLSNEEFLLLNKLSYHSSCLYNFALYGIRQAWINDNKKTSYEKDTYYKIKENEHFSILLNDTSSQIGRKAHQDFNSFSGLLNLKKKGEYNAKIMLPRYKKDKYKNTILSDIIIQGRSVRFVRENKHTNTFRINMSKEFKRLYPDLLNAFFIKVPKHIEKINEIKFKPKQKGKKFSLQVTFSSKIKDSLEDNNAFLSIDLGVNNLATCINSINGESFIIDGKKIKSINQHFNKKKAKIQSRIDILSNQGISVSFLENKLFKLNKKRESRIKAVFHLSTKYIVNYCLKNKINTVVVGENKGQKQDINIGKVNNQKFVSIPFFKFKNILEYKLNTQGITLVRHEESYTSKTSFLDLEEVKKHSEYVGKRTKRGLFRSKEGLLVNADVNGAANILRKYLKSKDKLKKWLKLFFNEVCMGIVNYPKMLSYDYLHNSMTSFNKNSLLQG